MAERIPLALVMLPVRMDGGKYALSLGPMSFLDPPQKLNLRWMRTVPGLTHSNVHIFYDWLDLSFLPPICSNPQQEYSVGLNCLINRCKSLVGLTSPWSDYLGLPSCRREIL